MGATNKKRNGRSSQAIASSVKKTGEKFQIDNTQEQQIADEGIQEELQKKSVEMISLEDLYSAPSSWNEWSKLPEDKLVQLCESIISIGIQNPCIVWKIDKEKFASLYDSNKEDSYDFAGSQYMILSGHNRASAIKLISETEKDEDSEEFRSVPCFVYEDQKSEEFVEKAKQIIDDTNYLSRDKTTKEIMRAIQKKYMSFENGKLRQKENVARSVAKSLNIDESHVFRYKKVANNLIPELQELLFEEIFSFNDAQKLAAYPNAIQKYLFNNHKNVLKNKRELKNFLKNTTKDMSISEIEEELKPVEKQVSYEKVTVTVPKDRLDEFNKMFDQWKNSNLN